MSALTKTGIQKTDNEGTVFTKRHLLVFKPDNLKNLPGFESLNRILDYSLDLDKMSMTLLYIYTTDEIFKILQKTPEHAAELLPIYSGQVRQDSKCYLVPGSEIVSDDISEVYPEEMFLRKLNRGDDVEGTYAVMYRSNYFINKFVELIRDYVVNRVVGYIKRKYYKSVRRLYVEETDNHIIIGYKLGGDMKVILMKCKIGAYNPHLTLHYINDNRLTERGVWEIIDNVKIQNKFKQSGINLTEGDFLFV